MKVTVFDPIRRQLELANVEIDLDDQIIEHYKREAEKHKSRAKANRSLLNHELGINKQLLRQLNQSGKYNRLLLVVLGELLVIAAWGLR
jgi:hypothetical protein